MGVIDRVVSERGSVVELGWDVSAPIVVTEEGADVLVMERSSRDLGEVLWGFRESMWESRVSSREFKA